MGTQAPAKSRCGKVDAYLLTRSRELLDSIDCADPINTQLNLTALVGTLREMWETATESSEIHQDILAAFENAVCLSDRAGTVNPSQLSAMREALADLAMDRLTPRNVEVVRARFVREGFGVLGFVGDADANVD